MNGALKIFSGSSNQALAQKIAKYLETDLSEVTLKKFKDGEISVKFEESVRGSDVFLIQSTSNPANDNLMELILMIDAAMRASAARITAVLPYAGYSRQDRKVEPRVPISAKVVANLLQAVGVNRILTMDLHADQIVGFYDIPVDNLFASPIMVDYLTKLNIENAVVVSPDAGGVQRARFLARKLNTGIAIVDKRRQKANECQVMNVIGDVKGKNCILIDDMIDTGGSIAGASIALKENGANDVYCVCSHAVFSGDAPKKLATGGFKELIYTDSIVVSDDKKLDCMKELTVAPLIGEAIKRIHQGESVSCLFI